MLASITPLGERARGTGWTVTVALFISAAIIAGAAVGAILGALGEPVLGRVGITWRLGLVGLVLAIGLAWEMAGWNLPGPRRQVNERWLSECRRWVYALGFGGQLGAGMTTIVVSSAVYAIWTGALVTASPAAGALIGAVAGALRGSTVLAGARIVSAERLVAFHARMRSLSRPVRRALLVGQLGLVVATGLTIVVAR